MVPEHRLDFSPYELDPDAHDLWRDGRRMHLRPKDFAVLQYLMEHSDRVVTKQERLARRVCV